MDQLVTFNIHTFVQEFTVPLVTCIGHSRLQISLLVMLYKNVFKTSVIPCKVTLAYLGLVGWLAREVMLTTLLKQNHALAATLSS